MSLSSYCGNDRKGYGLYDSGECYNSGSKRVTNVKWKKGDVVRVKVDLTDSEMGTLAFAYNDQDWFPVVDNCKNLHTKGPLYPCVTLHEPNSVFTLLPSVRGPKDRELAVIGEVGLAHPGDDIRFQLDSRRRSLRVFINGQPQPTAFEGPALCGQVLPMLSWREKLPTAEVALVKALRWEGAVDGAFERRDQPMCPPCFECELGGRGDEECSICCDRLRSAAAVRLGCGHTFHRDCVVDSLASRWSGVRISFDYLRCPLCRTFYSHPALEAALEPHLALHADVQRRALRALREEGLELTEPKLQPGGSYYGQPVEFAMHHYVFHQCFKCKKPYFAGAYECAAAGDDDQPKAEELVCAACSVENIVECPKHGVEWIQFKCKWCCSVASWHCWGNTHFCAVCHEMPLLGYLCHFSSSKPKLKPPNGEWLGGGGRHYNQENGGANMQKEYMTCPASVSGNPADCPLGCLHAPNGQECGLGCLLCKEEAAKEAAQEEKKARHRRKEKARDMLELLARVAPAALAGKGDQQEQQESKAAQEQKDDGKAAAEEEKEESAEAQAEQAAAARLQAAAVLPGSWEKEGGTALSIRKREEQAFAFDALDGAGKLWARLSVDDGGKVHLKEIDGGDDGLSAVLAVTELERKPKEDGGATVSRELKLDWSDGDLWSRKATEELSAEAVKAQKSDAEAKDADSTGSAEAGTDGSAAWLARIRSAYLAWHHQHGKAAAEGGALSGAEMRRFMRRAADKQWLAQKVRGKATAAQVHAAYLQCLEDFAPAK